MFVSILSLGYSQSASWNVTNVTTWIDAVNGIRSGGNNKEYAIIVTGTISVPNSAENTFGSVTGITVTIEGSGTLTPSSNGSLLRVGKNQTIIARNITLRGRDANTATVVRIENGGTFRMEGSSKVTGNKVNNVNGGGVYVDGGIFIMQDNASVFDNTAGYGSGDKSYGGGVYVAGGAFTMQDNASLTGNSVIAHSSWLSYSYAYGGGVCFASGTFTMQGNASVKGNAALTLGASGTANEAFGGGVYFNGGGTFIMQGNAVVADNNVIASGDGGAGMLRTTNNAFGGGVYIKDGTFKINGCTVSNNNAIVSGNEASNYANGGGVYTSGTFSMENSTISGNTGGSGGGLLSKGTSTILRNTTIRGNTARYGGAIYIESGSFTMEDEVSVSGNTSNDSGGGLYVNGGTLTMQGNSKVSNNTATGDGGGVYLSSGTFTMRGNASVSDNTSFRNGGGVSGGDGTFTIRDNALISGNIATYGGGMIFYKGTIKMEGGTISGNLAENIGGGVYLNGGNLTKTSGNIYGYDSPINLVNWSGSNGNSVYDEKGERWRNVSAGPAMSSDTYGFWLNDSASFPSGGESVLFPSGFIGTWKRSNLSNTLTFSKDSLKSSSQNSTWIIKGLLRDNTYIVSINNNNNYIAAITIKLIDGNIEISGDTGESQDNWNGIWRKQNASTSVSLSFPSGFIGTWKRSNFNNTLTFTEKTIRISSNSYTYEIVGISGDSITLRRSNANPFTLTIRLTNGNLVISGDSGSGQDNWNGIWIKQ